MSEPWMEIAKGELGVAEVAGGEDNPRILEYHAVTSLHATADEVPWCASFASWCLEQVGIESPRRANARSFLDWGEALAGPRHGCIVVFSRGKNPAAGHVAFYDSRHGDYLRVLGGNQGDQVSYARFSEADVLGYRWPKGHA